VPRERDRRVVPGKFTAVLPCMKKKKLEITGVGIVL
jgi:hypothetical protein